MANMKISRVLVIALLPLCANTAFADRGGDAIVGAAIGGIFGGVIGSQMGGRDGAIVGAGLGAMTGVAITSQGDRGYARYSDDRGYSRERDYYRGRGRCEERGYGEGHHGYYRVRDSDDWHRGYGGGYEGRHGYYR